MLALRIHVRGVIARPDYVARLTELAMQPLNLTPEQTNAVIKLEIEKWRKVAAAANITAQ